MKNNASQPLDLEIEVISSCNELISQLDTDGRQRAVRYLFERYCRFSPPSSENEKKLSHQKNSPAKKKDFEYKIIDNIDFNPTGSEGFTEFYDSHKAESRRFFEKNVLFVYYLKKKINLTKVGINHIYTCYKQASEKLPKNLYQSIVDTKKYKGWLSGKDLDDINITIIGENYVDHNLKGKE